MSFISSNETATVYAPGWFLANPGDTKPETKTIAYNHGNVQTAEGGKYVPMGAIFPSNDGNATGIIYEDVDVTSGSMPGAVVTNPCVVYEDRLFKTADSYDAASDTTGKNPSAEGWYERSGSSPNYVYTLSTDTTVGAKTYYIRSDVTVASAAKSALEALGFVFKTSPAVTRPY